MARSEASHWASTVNRRQFLAGMGAGTVATVAGCLGGGDGGGDGGGGQTATTMGGAGGDLQTVRFGSPPVGLPNHLVFNYLEENDLLAELFEPKGYELEVNLTWDDATLFASGQLDMTTISWFESARLSAEQDQELASVADIEAVIQGIHVVADGPYDPANTGGAQETVDKLVEEQGVLGIPGWAAGNMPHLQVVFDQLYGYTLAQEGGDFNTQQTDYGTMPQLLLREELDAADFAGTSAGTQELATGELKTVFWIAEGQYELGMAPGPLISLTARRSFAEEHPQALLSMIDVYNEGVAWIHENVDQLSQDAQIRETINADTVEAAEFLFNYIVKGEGVGGNPLLYEPPLGLTDQKVTQMKNLNSTLEDIGQLPSGWEESVTYYTRSELEGMV